jgi:gluconate 2-dehydrogenase gamma chain
MKNCLTLCIRQLKVQKLYQGTPEMKESVSRREFLSRGISGLSAAWVSAHLPAMVAAAGYARQAAKSAAPPKFQFFTPEQAVEVDAITARIIPTDELPGAREAGVVYFIDRGLATFAADDQETYREGLPELQARVTELFPSVAKFSALTPEQQDEVLHSFDESAKPARRPFRARPGAQNFFETLRQHTISGFLIDPDYGGNDSGAGWKAIGREREHMFQAPFGYYDKAYPGWEAATKEAEKK